MVQNGMERQGCVCMAQMQLLTPAVFSQPQRSATHVDGTRVVGKQLECETGRGQVVKTAGGRGAVMMKKRRGPAGDGESDHAWGSVLHLQGHQKVP